MPLLNRLRHRRAALHRANDEIAALAVRMTSRAFVAEWDLAEARRTISMRDADLHVARQTITRHTAEIAGLTAANARQEAELQRYYRSRVVLVDGRCPVAEPGE